MRSRGRESEAGYVLFGIAVGLVVLGVFMVAAVPLWQKLLQRQREKELIFRGYQYMQAIELYQKKFPGAFPPNLEALVEQKFLRRIYEDPMSESGEWRVLRQMSPELQPGAGSQQSQAAAAAGITDRNRSRGRMTTPGGSRGSTRSPAGGRFQSSQGRTRMGAGRDAGASLGGIVGVASSSDEEPFYQVEGKKAYRDWLFVYGVQQQMPAAQAPVPGGNAASRPGRSAVAAPRRSAPSNARSNARTSPPAGVAQSPEAALRASPFPGLPPPPGLTKFRFGSAAPAGAQPGQPPGTPPGAAPGPGRPRPGAPPGNPFAPGTGPRQGNPPPGGARPRPQPPQPRRPPANR